MRLWVLVDNPVLPLVLVNEKLCALVKADLEIFILKLDAA